MPLVYQGKYVGPALKVEDGRQYKMQLDDDPTLEPLWWDIGSGNVRARRQPVESIVLHHTAGEGGNQGIFHTLEQRNLSVHFSIDRAGRIMQHADIDHVTYHCGAYNARTIGVEIANKGRAPAHCKAHREEYIDTMHGRVVKFLRFYPEQVKATIDLVGALCELLHLVPSLPMVHAGNKVTRNLLPESERKHYGVLGHYHLTPAKIDPSPHILDEIAHHFGVP